MINFAENINKILVRHQWLSDKLAGNLSGDELIKLSKEYSELDTLVCHINAYNQASEDLKVTQELKLDTHQDLAMGKMIDEEIIRLETLLTDLERTMKVSLLPKDEADSKSAIIEIRAGTGGDEAGLFAADLFGMYQRYSEAKKWKFEILSISDTGIGGYKEATASVSGNGVFARLKFESGVHRVQRVPKTESNGRIHTSAATVAVLPEADDIDIKIEEKDLKIDTYRASGAGGQHVNTTDSAVRITHLPTGLVVCVQDERSQQQNKAKAFKILRARVYEAQRQQKLEERSLARKEQIGSGDRSERVRTYNFPQGRVTDHRINVTLYKIDAVLNGELDDFINALIADDEMRKLANEL